MEGVEVFGYDVCLEGLGDQVFELRLRQALDTKQLIVILVGPQVTIALSEDGDLDEVQHSRTDITVLLAQLGVSILLNLAKINTLCLGLELRLDLLRDLESLGLTESDSLDVNTTILCLLRIVKDTSDSLADI